MKKIVAALAIAWAAAPSGVWAEPVGQWYGDADQGALVYGFSKDRSGFDSIAILCGASEPRVRVSVGSGRPRASELVKFVIDGNEWNLFTNADQEVTPSTQDPGKFAGLWSGLRRGHTLRVQLASGGTATFPLRGAARVLPSQPCG